MHDSRLAGWHSYPLHPRCTGAAISSSFGEESRVALATVQPKHVCESLVEDQHNAGTRRLVAGQQAPAWGLEAWQAAGWQAQSPGAALLVASQMFAYVLSPTPHVNTRSTAATELHVRVGGGIGNPCSSLLTLLLLLATIGTRCPLAAEPGGWVPGICPSDPPPWGQGSFARPGITARKRYRWGPPASLHQQAHININSNNSNNT